MDESRKAFESWCRVTRPCLTTIKNCDRKTYSHDKTQAAWKAWQASRAAIELDIDWPEANDDTWMEGEDGAYARGHEDGKDKVVIAVRQAISAAGIKVKE
ncbi:TPA: hypothetical protein O8L32_000559 [Enterobacter cloacae]|nr:hypothetical protein [Enterobacter cloacae]